jgi:hypothetical protein
VRIHWLKCWAENFDEIAAGRKRCEIRREDDRVFRVGDALDLVRTDRNGVPTAPETRIVVQVLHIDRQAGELELMARANATSSAVDGARGAPMPIAVLSIAATVAKRAGQ